MCVRTGIQAMRAKAISPGPEEKKQTGQACVRARCHVMRAAAAALPPSAWKRPVNCLVRSRQGRGFLHAGSVGYVRTPSYARSLDNRCRRSVGTGGVHSVVACRWSQRW